MSDRSPSDVLYERWPPICSLCEQTLTSPGALIFGPPADSRCEKRHVCADCWPTVLVVRPGDPWTDTDGRRWDVEQWTDGATPESAHLWPEDDGTPDDLEQRRIAGL